MSDTSTGQDHDAGRYKIRLKGHLAARWTAWFDGLSISRENDGTTIISGLVADQAALHGLLQKVRDIGMPLVSVTQSNPTSPTYPSHLDKYSTNTHKEKDMTSTIQPTRAKTTATKRVPMDSLRKTALVAGLFYLITFISIPTLALYGPVLSDPNYIVGSGPDTPVIIGGILEMIVALAGIGTAVALYPVVKRQNEGVALGFVGSRTLEAATIFAGVVSLLSVVTLRQAGAGAEPWSPARRWSPSRLVVPPRTKPHAGRERRVAGLPAVPVAPGAAGSSRAGIHRSALASRFRSRQCCSASGTGCRAVGAPRNPDRAMGVLARRLSDRQRLQALPDHSRHDHFEHRPDPPRPRRLTADDTARPTEARPLS